MSSISHSIGGHDALHVLDESSSNRNRNRNRGEASSFALSRSRRILRACSSSSSDDSSDDSSSSASNNNVQVGKCKLNDNPLHLHLHSSSTCNETTAVLWDEEEQDSIVSAMKRKIVKDQRKRELVALVAYHA